MSRKYWHLQMFLPRGRKGEKINSIEMLQEKPPIIGTGEWEDTQCNQFKNTLQNGHIVLIREGGKVLAICEVISDNFQSEELTTKYINKNFRHVKVLQFYSNINPFPQPQGTLQRLVDKNTDSYRFIDSLYKIYLKEQTMQKEINTLKQKKQIILQGAPGTGKTYVTAEIAVKIINPKFEYKTSNDKEQREELMKEYKKLTKEERIHFTTFHQSMDYEEFVEGYKPNGNGGFELRDGIFKKACNSARTVGTGKIELDKAMEQFIELIKNGADENPFKIDSSSKEIQYTLSMTENGHIDFLSPNAKKPYYRTINEIKGCYSKFNDPNHMGIRPYQRSAIQYMIDKLDLLLPSGTPTAQPVILIIDEINRGHISKIFGELITLLEADKRHGMINAIPAKLTYSEDPFTVPQNLYIIGTMNTADRTIGYIDYALRRRFAFINLPADVTKVTPIATELFKKVEGIIGTYISNEFEADDLMIGHSYFIVENDEELQLKLDYEIKPLLLEYLKDGILIDKDSNLKTQIEKLSI